ncbi:EcKinase and/or APH domain containing protein, partial [Asbolus verrucosus]
MIDFIQDIQEKFNKSKENLIRSQEVERLEEVRFNKEEIKYIVSDMLFEDPQHHVILHDDCWTNNFMFKYEEDFNKPTDIYIIDWQCSGIGSPVID